MPPDHELKCVQPYFDLVCNRIKTFEVRKDDRGGFKQGQRVCLYEYERETMRYTGDWIEVEILYVLDSLEADWGIESGYVVFGIKVVGDAK